MFAPCASPIAPVRIVAACALSLALALAGGCGNDPAPEKTVTFDTIEIGDQTVECTVVRTHAGRVALAPEQMQASRPVADRLAALGPDRAIVFAYPDAEHRSVHLDRDPRGGAIGVAFLSADGTVDSARRVDAKEQAILSRRAIQFTLFCDASWIGERLKDGVKITLPANAAEGAEAEVSRIDDPPPTDIVIGGKTIKVEVAWRTNTRARGLMYRQYIADDTGMLFLFPAAKQQRFWMRNTRTSLDIAYIADDRIKNIITMKAHDLDPGAQYQSDGPVDIALETPAGWFRKNGIKAGAKLELPDSIKAFRAKAHP